MILSRILLEYLRVLDRKAQYLRNLGKGALSFPGMSESHNPKWVSHTENHLRIFFRSDGEMSRYFIFGFELPTPFARIITWLRRKQKIHETKMNVQEAGLAEQLVSLWEGDLVTKHLGISPGTGFEMFLKPPGGKSKDKDGISPGTGFETFLKPSGGKSKDKDGFSSWVVSRSICS